MKKYTIEELTKIFEKYQGRKVTYTAADRERILNNPALKPNLDSIKEGYEEYTASKTVALPFSAYKRFFIDGDRKDGEYWYYYNRRKLGVCALMAWLYGEEEYISQLEDILWAIMDEYVWNIPAHMGKIGGLTDYQPDDFSLDLFSSETCMVISQIIANLGDKMEPIVSIRARRLLEDRCFKVFDKPYWWKKSTNNWSAVCAGQIGHTAFFAGKEPAELARIIYGCLDAFEYFLQGFMDDGACTEGLGYWGYGFGNYAYFGDLLYTYTDGEINLFEDEKIRRIAAFPHKCFFKGGKKITFSDCGASDKGTFSLPLTMTLNKYFPEITLPEPSLVDSCCGNGYRFSFFVAMKTLTLMPDLQGGKPLDIAGKTYIFPDAQWYISSSKGGMGIAAKGGHNNEAHNHNDIGTFHIYKNNANLISDIGAGVYRAGYFTNHIRYKNFACSSEGHSVPIIDGTYQMYGREHEARDVVISEESGISMDIASAYTLEGLESLVRRIYLNNDEERVYLSDTYRFKESPKSVTERFISYHEPKIEDGRVTIEANGEVLLFGYDECALKPTVRVYEDVDCLVRHTPGFKAYMVDFEVINPAKEFTVSITFE
ncbi:MAG: heparinase II/III family protein [Clostridia bacterium]|nr:heparinase II/III family protein [Clostridia bacterium]